MKTIAKLLLALLGGIILTSNVYAQESSKDVTITTSGSGATLEDAKQSALRSATEQAFGAFISSKTEIFNDQVVADQMSSVSSGNIKSYEVLNEDQFPDGRWGATIKAIVSVDKLTSFVQAKGVEIEIKGGLFALNIKQQLLNEQGEVEAVYAMVGLLHEPMQTAFDYTIKSGDPKSTDAESKNWEIPLEVTVTCNKNMDFCANYFIKTLRALSLSVEEAASYKALNKKVFPVNVTFDGKAQVFNLRKEKSLAVLTALMSNWEFYTRLFEVKSGLDEQIGQGNTELFDFGEIQFDSDKLYEEIYELDFVRIKFPSVNRVVGVFTWYDKRTLDQIEKMNGYSVKSRGVVSNFKHGGYVVWEKDGHGLVAALWDLGRNFESTVAKLACEELVMNGYSDWHLPSKEDLQYVYTNLYQAGIGGLKEANYLSSTSHDYGCAWGFYFDDHLGYITYKNYPTYVRPVRTF
jgi:hypothetical protein